MVLNFWNHFLLLRVPDKLKNYFCANKNPSWLRKTYFQSFCHYHLWQITEVTTALSRDSYQEVKSTLKPREYGLAQWPAMTNKFDQSDTLPILKMSNTLCFSKFGTLSSREQTEANVKDGEWYLLQSFPSPGR